MPLVYSISPTTLSSAVVFVPLTINLASSLGETKYFGFCFANSEGFSVSVSCSNLPVSNSAMNLSNVCMLAFMPCTVSELASCIIYFGRMGICSSKFSARVAPLTITPTEVTTPPLPTSNTQKESAGLHSEAGEDRTSLASKSVALNGGDSRLFSPQVIHINPSIPPNFFPSHRESAAEIQCRKTAAQLKPRKSEATIRDEVQQLIAQWEKSGELSVIENHVLSVSSSQTSSIQELSDALVAPYATYIEQLKGKQLHLEVAKAYAIYFWITTNIKYDRVAFQGYLSGEKPSKEEPSHVLIARKSMCCGYSNLFKALAVHIGMQATVIQGHTKSWQIFSDDQNAPFTPSRPNSHFWNAVSESLH